MANPLVGGVVGAFLGGFFGPIGAQIGWVVGSALTTDPVSAEPRDPGDTRVQTAAYGGQIPQIIGRQRLAGNIIWSKDLDTYLFDPNTGLLGYKLTCAIAFCEGEVLGWNRIWMDDELVVDCTDGIAKPGLGNFYPGSLTQNPDPVIESYEGVGNVPGYRGICYVVLNQFDLGPSNRIPKFELQLLKEGGF